MVAIGVLDLHCQKVLRVIGELCEVLGWDGLLHIDACLVWVLPVLWGVFVSSE